MGTSLKAILVGDTHRLKPRFYEKRITMSVNDQVHVVCDIDR